MRFSYYERLSLPEKRTYRKSDGVRTVVLPNDPAFEIGARSLERALQGEKRTAVRRAAQSLCNAIFDALGVTRVAVKVLAQRPRDQDGELHGMYTWEEGKTPQIEVWMRTAEHRRVVAFRTFLRTLLHEVCHHLDYTLLGLSDTFHTEGFFRRESSLFRQLVPEASKAARSKRARPAEATRRAREKGPPTRRRGHSPGSSQLTLFDASS